MSAKPILYLQTDPQWGKIPFTSHNDPTQTISSSGCGVACAAMVLADLLDDPTIKPDYTAKLCVDNGYRTYNQGTDFAFYPFIAQKFGLQLVESTKIEDAIWALQHNGLAICSMTPVYFTTVGHFILAYDVVDGNIVVNDPAHPTRTQASFNIFKQQCQRYFIFYGKSGNKVIFNDTQNSFVKQEIEELAQMGIVEGDGSGNFRPNDNVTREEMAMIARNIVRYIMEK